MNIQDRVAALRQSMGEQGLELLIGLHDNGHFIEKPNPVMVLAGFKSMGDTALLLHRSGEALLIVTPAWDAERAAEQAPGWTVVGTHELLGELARQLGRLKVPAAKTGVAGLAPMSWQVEKGVRELMKGEVHPADALVMKHARRKTAEEIARARKATELAEKGYEQLLATATVGMREDQLAAEIRCYVRSLGAEDNFFMFNAGPFSKAVQTSCGRRFAQGDLLLGELTPSYQGQMAQICRTAVLGRASEVRKEKYALLVHAMKQGVAAARPGNTMGKVCEAINAVLEAQGYGQYCHPPHIKRRGHGLGFGSTLPGDVAPDNGIVLEPDMFFVIHPNQFLPETGYMMCGEPTLITENGAQLLSRRMAQLYEIPV
ncbi:MAG: aminopeptidase P family protein [Burkholderiales bacterium]|nr:aminopeptidase P family protein [Burkholderiales bacterium]